MSIHLPNSAAENFRLQLAKIRVQAFADESDVMKNQNEATDWRACESFLQSGINAYRWLTETEAAVRDAEDHDSGESSCDIEAAIESLYQAWLEPCELAENWISRVQCQGFTVANVDEFREICEDVDEKIRHLSWVRMSTDAVNRFYLSDEE